MVFIISLYINPKSVTGCMQRRQCIPGDLHTVIIIVLLSMDEKRTIRSDLKISALPLNCTKTLDSQSIQALKTN